MNQTKYFFSFLFILVISALEAAAIKDTRLFNDRSLTSSSYASICLDASGNLWIGTEYGLLRFDGTNFDKYHYDDNSDKSLSDSRVIKVLRDTSDRIWVATAEGLNLYKPEIDGFQCIELPNLPFNGYITDMYCLSSGDLIFMVAGVGLHIIDFSSGSPVAVRYLPENRDMLTINTIGETDDNFLIGGNHAGQIFKIAPNGKIVSRKIADSYIRTLLRDGNGNFFISTTDRAWRWNPVTDTYTQLSIDGSFQPFIHTATLTGNGNILIGTLGNGLYFLEKDSDTIKPCYEYTNAMIDINLASIHALYEDPDANLWLGCSNQGLLMVPSSGMPFRFINLARIINDYTGGETRLATDDRDNSIWTALENGYLLHIDHNGNLLYSYKFNNTCRSLCVTGNGTVYAGVDNEGVYELTPLSATPQKLVGPKGTYMVRSVTHDSSGTIYVSIHGEGVIAIDPSTRRHEWIRDGETNPTWPSVLFCDSNDRLWIGMYGGLAVYDPITRKINPLSERHSHMIKGVHNALAEDADGNIWDATSNGLFIVNLDTDSCRRLTPKDGLSDIFISTVVFDNEGNAWISTHDGINRISPDGSITPFHNNSNLADSDYLSAARDDNGKYLLFSGKKGITILEPALLNDPAFERDICISGIYLNGKRVNNSTLTAAGNKYILTDSAQAINLAYNDNAITIHLSTRDFREPDNVVWQWRIPGLVDDWVSSIPGCGTITLPHIEPGKHDLQIRANENGVISPVKHLTISVSPPWYLTTPVKIILLALIVALIFLATKLMRKRNSERINEEKIKFFINVSHEIRSPLTLILSPLERIMKKEHDPDTTRNLNAIHRNANRILALINQLLDIRKMEKGKMEIHRTETEFISFTSELVDIFKSQANEKNLELSFSISDPALERLDVWIDRNNFDKVLVNLITNAIKYTPEGGKINVEVSKGSNSSMGDYAQVSVKDTGIGLDEKNVDRLFDRFYQGKFNKGSVPLGFGIGLDLCRLLVELHHGSITAANRLDTHGSIFTVRIPLGQKFADDSSSDNTLSDTTQRSMPSLAPSVPNTPPKRARRNSSLRILVADDDTEIRQYLCDLLAGFGKVIAAADGQEALQLVTGMPVDLIVTDVVMPRMDGLTLLKRVKGNVATSHIPVILLSSKNEVADRMSGWEKGADGYLGKPFNIEELYAIIDSMIDNRFRMRGKYSGTQEHAAAPASATDIKGNDAQLIEKITSAINNRIEDPDLNVETLCQDVGLSRAHLNRKMKELFGLTPSDFIRNVRLSRACELLKKPDIDISQIAYSVGFTSQPHFSTAFKRFTGISPTDYRQQNTPDEQTASISGS